ncbi:MAG: hypothetical protein A2494_02220 [Candidatus Lloydbacteria bacterium RIFOXYC12_FULL_46_25]|uniref:Uncharacterized protein n=1 Tax=Candidatus Lloydbacteria bacterium RIFOXYC12_FULL_46_25 TaxID=1798670 RepID=A0A1G2E199_9BACT|nr:MAG: hypothetical protein A2494_02220 [Candidatus Lloydbacteria bacterium RIFOXYC12_FULL_46_25]
MEKGYRELKCSGCPKKLRITITELHYGKRVEVTCPHCCAKTRVIIPVPAPDKKDASSFIDELYDVFDIFSGKSK